MPEISKVLQSGISIDGPYTQRLEAKLCQMSGFAHAITVNSGTQALELLAEHTLLQVRKYIDLPTPAIVADNFVGKALIPALTFRATANAFIRAGWDIDIGDVDYDGLLIQPDNTEYAVAVPVGLYGQNFPTKNNLVSDFRVLDGAQSWLGVESEEEANVERLVGQAISFDPTKNLSAIGNGGAILTNSSRVAEWARQMRAHGANPQTLVTTPVFGTNSRISEIDAAVLCVKIQYVYAWQARRREIALYWNEQFKNLPIRSFVTEKNIRSHGLQKYVIQVDCDVRLLANKLHIKGIWTKRHYEQPLHEMSAYSHYPNPGLLSTASAMARRVLSLPFYPELTDEEVEYIGKTVASAVEYMTC